jgi:hypothetical protein
MSRQILVKVMEPRSIRTSEWRWGLGSLWSVTSIV